MARRPGAQLDADNQWLALQVPTGSSEAVLQLSLAGCCALGAGVCRLRRGSHVSASRSPDAEVFRA